MGYYVRIEESDFTVLAEHEAAALQALKDLNKRDDLKRGGSWSSGKAIQKWFSWMDANYDQKVTSVQDVLTELGFETRVEEDGTHIDYYDNKTGQEDLFLQTLAPFVKDGSYIIWRGEEGEIWRDLFDGKTLTIQPGKVTFE